MVFHWRGVYGDGRGFRGAHQNDIAEMTLTAIRPMLVLASVLFATWSLIAWPTCLYFDTDTKVASLAATINLLPGWWTLILIERSRRIDPTLQIAALTANALIRLIFPVVAGGLGWYLISELQGRELELVVWSGVFYVVSLITGTTLSYRIVTS